MGAVGPGVLNTWSVMVLCEERRVATRRDQEFRTTRCMKLQRSLMACMAIAMKIRVGKRCTKSTKTKRPDRCHRHETNETNIIHHFAQHFGKNLPSFHSIASDTCFRCYVCKLALVRYLHCPVYLAQTYSRLSPPQP